MTNPNPILHEAAGWILTDKAVLLPESHLRAMFHRLKTSGEDERIEKAIAKNVTVSQIATAGVASQSVIACIPICGVLNKQYDGWGMCSTTRLIEQLAGAIADPAVSSIVLDIDSPGGFVNGSVEFADAVAAANQIKPVTAVVRGLCCSGAYWIASQCGKIISRPECEVGNIGVYSVLMDVSKLYESLGISLTTIASGDFKGLGADGKVTDVLIADTKRIVTGLYAQFVNAVAQGRGLDTQEAMTLADGRAFLGPQAKQLKLIDALASSFAQAIDISTGATSPESESDMASATKTNGTPPQATAATPLPAAATAPAAVANPVIKSEDKKDGKTDHNEAARTVLEATIKSAADHKTMVRQCLDHASDMEGEADEATKSLAKRAVASLKATSDESARAAKAWLSKADSDEDDDGDDDGDGKDKPDEDGGEDKSQGGSAAQFIAAFGDPGAKMFLDKKPFAVAAAEHIAQLKSAHKIETDRLKAENVELTRKLAAMPRGNEEVRGSLPEDATTGPSSAKGQTLTPGLSRFAAGIKIPGQK